MKLLFRSLLILFLLLAVPSWAGNIPTTFYVDQTGGNDSNTGLATDNAWKTVAKVNAFSRTNLLAYSEQFELWTRSGAVVFENTTVAPDGTTTADTIQNESGISNHVVYKLNGTSSAQPYTQTVYSKPGTVAWLGMTSYSTAIDDGAFFNVSNGTIGTVSAGITASITPAPNGYYRCSITKTHGTANYYGVVEVHTADNQASNYDAAGTETLILWGDQVEVGAFPSPYVPTVADPVAASFQPGDNVLFKRGETWASEQIVVPSSGSASASITFGRYGSGADPIFSAAPDENGQTYIVLDLETAASTGRPTLPNWPAFPSFPAWR